MSNPAWDFIRELLDSTPFLEPLEDHATDPDSLEPYQALLRNVGL